MLILFIISCFNINFKTKFKTVEDELRIACQNKNVEKVEKLIKSNVNVNFGYGNSQALLAACESGSLEIVKLLVETGANIDGSDQMGNTPLIMACKQHYTQIAKFLIENNANVNFRDETTALIEACKGDTSKKENIEVIKLLIENGADPNSTNFSGRTPLIYICSNPRSSLEIVKLLIEAGADVNKRDEDNYTPLLDASPFSVDIFKLLLKSGADPTAKNIKNQTPLIKVCVSGGPKGIEIKSQLEILEMLLSFDAVKRDINLKDNDGFSALSRACIAENILAIAFLISQGADINISHNIEIDLSKMKIIVNNRLSYVHRTLDENFSKDIAGIIKDYFILDANYFFHSL